MFPFKTITNFCALFDCSSQTQSDVMLWSESGPRKFAFILTRHTSRPLPMSSWPSRPCGMGKRRITGSRRRRSMGRLPRKPSRSFTTHMTGRHFGCFVMWTILQKMALASENEILWGDRPIRQEFIPYWNMYVSRVSVRKDSRSGAVAVFYWWSRLCFMIKNCQLNSENWVCVHFIYEVTLAQSNCTYRQRQTLGWTSFQPGLKLKLENVLMPVFDFYALFSLACPETSTRVSSTLRESFDSSFERKRWSTGRDGQKDLPRLYMLWWQTPPHSTKLFTYFSISTTVHHLATSPDSERTRVILSASAFVLGVAVMSWWEFTIQRTPAAHGTRQIRSVTKAPTQSCIRLFRHTPTLTTQAKRMAHHSTLVSQLSTWAWTLGAMEAECGTLGRTFFQWERPTNR